MRITTIVILTPLIFSLGCTSRTSEEAPPDRSNDVEFMCSIDGIVNRDYRNSVHHAKSWRDAYYQKMKELDYDYSEDMRIEIPDSISESAFKIKKGYYVASFDSSRLRFTDQVASFYSKVYQGSGEALAYFGLRENEKPGKFSIIVKSRPDLQLVCEKVRSRELNDTERLFVEGKVIAYFDSSRSQLFDQISPMAEVGTEATSQDSRQIIKERFYLRYLRTDVNEDSNDDYIVVGNDMEDPHLSFTAIVLGGIDEVLMKTHSRFSQVIRIADRTYLLLFQYKPYTGLKGHFLYRIDESELRQVFADLSYAD